MSDKNTECSKLHYADGSSISVRHDEIDLLRIVDTLLAAKWYIIIFAFISALLGAAVFSFLPQRWTSESLITPAEQTQWYELQKMLSELQVLGVEVNVSRNDVFNLFIKKMKSQSLFR
ncbi:LPS O-antigen length regulator, partial [Escherichia coli]|nr:LPS O-antigen length regulator [Escherichia coli]